MIRGYLKLSLSVDASSLGKHVKQTSNKDEMQGNSGMRVRSRWREAGYMKLF